MKISKQDALIWFDHFAQMSEEEEITPIHEEIIFATFAQIEATVFDRQEKLKKQIPGLKSLQNRTLYVGPDDHFPQGCKSCLLGSGLSAVRKTHTCNLNCKFCYNYGEIDAMSPVGEGLWEIGGSKFYERDLELLLSIHQKPTGISYVYLEPFMEIEKYYPVIRRFKNAGIHQHMYTNGTLATEENLKALAEAGLNELRFNLGASNTADFVIENMKTAKKYIPFVGIETPMTPEFFQAFLAKKELILQTQLDFMNCAELHLNENNIDNYSGENMYISRHGYISPIWSRELSLQLMAVAGREQWGIVVHDCSNDTKFARGLNLSNKEGKWFGASDYACEFESFPFSSFLPVLNDENFHFLEEETLPIRYQPPMLKFDF